jgi:hypothetical protein
VTKNRNPPRWLKSLVPLSLSIGVLATLGCGGKANHTPQPVAPTVLGNSAAITSVVLSSGTMMPKFTQAVRSYSANVYVGTSDLTVTVVLEDPKATLTLNGVPTNSGMSSNVIQLKEGITDLAIIATSEDRRNTNLVSVRVKKVTANTHVWVLNSVGGTHLEDALVTLKDAETGTILEENLPLPAEKNGSLFLGLDPDKKYDIYAKGKNSAEACFANFDPSREDTVTLYCLPHAPAFPAEAPIITDIAFSYYPESDEDNFEFRSLPPSINSLVSTWTDMEVISVTALAKSAITEQSWGPRAINVAVDTLAWLETPSTYAVVESAVPQIHNGQEYYRTTYLFLLPVSSALPSKDHWLSIVTYDVANNRTEQRVYLTITDSAPDVSADTNISAINPELTLCQAQTYGISMELPAINPVEAYGVTYRTYLEFALDPTLVYGEGDELGGWVFPDYDFPVIRGFEVWRSIGNDKNFKKIDTVHYTQAYDGRYNYIQVSYTDRGGNLYNAIRKQRFAYADISSDAVEDVMYYKFVPFNGNPANGGMGLGSNVLRTKPLPPFTTRLVEPHNGAVSKKVFPTFRFLATNPALLDAGNSFADDFIFNLYCKPLTGHGSGSAPINTTFKLDFGDIDDQGQPFPYYWDPRALYVNSVFVSWGYWKPATINGQRTGTPFVWIEDGNTIVIDTDNDEFRRRNQDAVWGYAVLNPGFTYEWSIFGRSGGIANVAMDNIATNAAFFQRAYTTPDGYTSNAFSFGSISDYGLGAPNGFFRLTVDVDAE